MTPRKQEKVFPRRYAKELITIALGDMDSAKALARSLPAAGRRENICLLIHQAVEKATKAVLVHYTISVPLVHDLGALIARIPSEASFPMGYELLTLNDFATVRRYEESVIPITDAELKMAFELAETALSWARKIIER